MAAIAQRRREGIAPPGVGGPPLWASASGAGSPPRHGGLTSWLPLWAAPAVRRGSAPSARSSARRASPRRLALSVRLAVITTLITIALILPTAVYVHLRLPKLRRLPRRDHDLAIVIRRWC